MNAERAQMTIRTENGADRDGIREVISAAFGRETEARLVAALRASPEYVPELSLVAEQDGSITGHVLFSRVTVDGIEQGLLGLGPVAVRPERQRAGIGGALIQAGVERARAGGYRGVVVLGHPEYYPRFGFAPASRFGLGCTFEVPDPVFMALPLEPGSLNGVQGTIRYAAAFDDC